jgi:transcriptional regulator with XRE-family HTH domain
VVAKESDPDVLRERARIGDRVRILREARGLTQDRLGELSGMDRKTVNRIEQARYPSVVDRFIRVANGLGVPVASLFAHDGDVPPGGGPGGGELPPLRAGPRHS